jgi:hypothetical protein
MTGSNGEMGQERISRLSEKKMMMFFTGNIGLSTWEKIGALDRELE